MKWHKINWISPLFTRVPFNIDQNYVSWKYCTRTGPRYWLNIWLNFDKNLTENLNCVYKGMFCAMFWEGEYFRKNFVGPRVDKEFFLSIYFLFPLQVRQFLHEENLSNATQSWWMTIIISFLVSRESTYLIYILFI